MEKPLMQALKDKILAEIPAIEYWKEAGSPHNDPGEGFFCNKYMVGISFPGVNHVRFKLCSMDSG